MVSLDRLNPSSCNIALLSIQPVTGMSTRNISCDVQAADVFG